MLNMYNLKKKKVFHCQTIKSTSRNVQIKKNVGILPPPQTPKASVHPALMTTRLSGPSGPKPEAKVAAQGMKGVTRCLIRQSFNALQCDTMAGKWV